MAKKKIRITVEGQLIVAPIWNIEETQWNDTELGCPICKLFSPIQPKVDVIQFGLNGDDTVHTVAQCRYCGGVFALKYVNNNEVVE